MVYLVLAVIFALVIGAPLPFKFLITDDGGARGTGDVGGRGEETCLPQSCCGAPEWEGRSRRWSR